MGNSLLRRRERGSGPKMFLVMSFMCVFMCVFYACLLFCVGVLPDCKNIIVLLKIIKYHAFHAYFSCKMKIEAAFQMWSLDLYDLPCLT